MVRCADSNCGYYYKAEGDKFPCCHCDLPDGWAPCERDDDDNED